MRISGEVTHTSGFIESVYKTDLGVSGAAFEPVYASNQHIGFNPPMMQDAVGPRQTT